MRSSDFVDGPQRVSGRLCLVEADARIARAAALRNQAALVIEVPHGDDASEAAALADVTVLVAAAATPSRRWPRSWARRSRAPGPTRSS